MNYAADSKTMKEIDSFSINYGMPSLVLMERAAYSVCEEIIKNESKKSNILVVCGYGNNGGDGIAIARILREFCYNADILMVGNSQKRTEDNEKQEKIAKNLVNYVNKSKIFEYNIIIDAIFGIGLSRDITGEYYSVIEDINNSGATIYAVDVPSGINVDNGKVMNICVKADYTITFGINKLGLLLYPANSFCGKIIIKNIGFLKDAINECTLRNNTKMYLDENVKDILPLRRADSNKGTYKKLLIIAGNDNMCGAAYLAAKAAYKLGCGLCNIFTSKSNVSTLHGLIPEAIVSYYDGASENDEDIIDRLDKTIKEHDAVIIGPGTGISDLQKKMIKKVLEYDIPKVFDADAINNISLMDKHGISFRNVIFTPHLKELSRLIDKDVKYVKENKDDAIKLFFEQYNCDNNENCILVAKDARTYISNNKECYINLTGNHGLSTGGSGDVLTGIIASLLCQGEDYYMAAVKGVYIHGICADNYAKRSNAYSLIASDIINELEHI